MSLFSFSICEGSDLQCSWLSSCYCFTVIENFISETVWKYLWSKVICDAKEGAILYNKCDTLNSSGNAKIQIYWGNILFLCKQMMSFYIFYKQTNVCFISKVLTLIMSCHRQLLTAGIFLTFFIYGYWPTYWILNWVFETQSSMKNLKCFHLVLIIFLSVTIK